jgi:hypothetical protein
MRLGISQKQFIKILFFTSGILISLSHSSVGMASPKEFLSQTFAGYQGWFNVRGLSSNNRWKHWAEGVSPQPGKITFELYPDVREYHPQDLKETSLGPLGNGESSKLFPSDSPRVVDTHFRWMAEYGIDGVALQRFVSELSDPAFKKVRDDVAGLVRESAQKWDRSFYMEYDISGASPDTLIDDIKKDWAELEAKLVNSSQYARHQGKPVVALWGFGFTDRPGTQAQAQELIKWFHDKGYFVIGGVPYWWRLEKENSKPAWLSTYLKYDMIQPWAVGAFADSTDLARNHVSIHEADKKLTDAHGLLYQRVIFPGFSWSNWNGGKFNQIPREAGQLLWSQGYFARKLGVTAFIAMFDEYDESTAIAKAAENAAMTPQNQKFLTLDADGINVSSDFYLRLAGQITKVLRRERPASQCVDVPYRLDTAERAKILFLLQQRCRSFLDRTGV